MTEQLSAAQRSKIRKLAAPKELSPDEEGGELNIVPFLDIVMNVLMFVLATISVTFTATIDTAPPKAGGGRANANQTPTLGLTIIIVGDGYSMKARGGNVAPGCNDLGAGIAVPKKGNDYDTAALKACADKLKSSSPDFKEERQVTISANPNIPYSVIIATMDAVRSRDLKPGQDAEKDADKLALFPDVMFGLAR
ncbi:MAG: biopolymer transporter ExbD [Polyangiaceae bacterium]